jgi:hypothetical protein
MQFRCKQLTVSFLCDGVENAPEYTLFRLRGLHVHDNLLSISISLYNNVGIKYLEYGRNTGKTLINFDYLCFIFIKIV